MNTFWHGLAVAFFIVVAFMLGRGCGSTTVNHNDTLRVVNIFDTTYHVIESSKVIYVHDRDTVIIPQKTDTAIDLRQFFTRHDFLQDIEDSNLKGSYRGELFKNELLSGKFSYKLLRPQSVTTTTLTEPPRVKVFMGATLNTTFGAGGELLLLTKREQLFSVGYDFVNKKYQAGAAFKISFR